MLNTLQETLHTLAKINILPVEIKFTEEDYNKLVEEIQNNLYTDRHSRQHNFGGPFKEITICGPLGYTRISGVKK